MMIDVEQLQQRLVYMVLLQELLYVWRGDGHNFIILHVITLIYTICNKVSTNLSSQILIMHSKLPSEATSLDAVGQVGIGGF